MDKARFAEAGMGVGRVVIGDEFLTDNVCRTHGKDIAAAYNRIAAREQLPGDAEFIRAWVYDAAQPAVQK